jgi:hypothetical protein
LAVRNARNGSSRIHKTNPMEPPNPGNIAHLLSLSGGQRKLVRRYLMLNRLMITAATAALIAGTGFANAQGTGMGREGSPAGSAVQQSQGAAPSAAPANRDATESAAPSGRKSTQSEEKMQPQGNKNQRAQQDMKSGPRDEKSAQENNMRDNNIKGEKSKSMNSENEKGPASKDMKAEGREDRNGKMNADKSGTESRSQTVGQAGAGAKLSTEQRTRITTVIRDQHVAPLNTVNFSIAVGTRVPRDVTFHRLPAEIVSIYPEWRGYEYILVRDQILVVDPQTFEIVAVLDT